MPPIPSESVGKQAVTDKFASRNARPRLRSDVSIFSQRVLAKSIAITDDTQVLDKVNVLPTLKFSYRRDGIVD